MADFVHLHVRSEYSLLDGACRIKELVSYAKELGMKALALTDRGVMYGAVAFYQACTDAGIKPIIGCEIELREVGDKEGDSLVLLVKDARGYHNLSNLVTSGCCSDGGVDPRLLKEHSEGLIALSGGMRGGVSRRILAGDRTGALEHAQWLKGLFGEDFYLEGTSCAREGEMRLLPALIRLGEQLGVKVAATNDVCFLRAEDAMTRQILTCIGRGVIFDEVPRGDKERYLKDADEMASAFSTCPQALSVTLEIAEKCSFTFSFGKTKLPRFDPPGGVDPKTYLATLTEEGLKKRLARGEIVYDQTHDEETYRMRIRYEQVVIGSMGYAPYFLIVADFVGWAKSKRIPTGPGRGSGAGSLVAYLIGITEVDPVKYGLLFESFLNPERISMPDFDIDFCDRRRDEVISYVTKRYGADHVCQIVTFGTMAARAAVRDVGRVLGMSVADVDAVARLIPRELKITLKQAKEKGPLADAYAASESVKRLIDLAMSVEGMPRNVSTHAAGVVITDLPLTDYLPLTRSGEVTLTQYDMDTVARLGLLKFDFLALRYLTVIDDTVSLIKEQSPTFSLQSLPLDDEATYALISAGKTDGLFQLESPGMRQLLTAFKPRCLTDIMTAIALFRPGPMDSIDKYLENRSKEGGISYPVEGLKEILDETCGCIVYQEQVMEVFRAIAGYTYGKADVVRRAISKKKPEVLARERSSFIAGAVERGVKREVAQALFEDMTDFAGYGFKKSHAAAYALLSYQTAYLKTHFTAAYYASLLSSVLGNLPKMGEYIAECAKLGIATLPPDINCSKAHFVPCKEGIRFGLLALKNVGTPLIARIVKEREQGEFTSLYDLLRRISGPEVNKRAIEALIRAGALDGLGANRAQMLACYEELADQFAHGDLIGQMDLFGNEQVGFSYPSLPDLPMKEKLRMEKEICGTCLSGHYLDSYRRNLAALGARSIPEIVSLVRENGLGEGDLVLVCGMVNGKTDKTTKNGDAMAFLRLEDRGGEIECIVFPKLYQTVAPLLQVEAGLAIQGKINLRDEEIKLLAERIVPLIPDERFHPETYRSPFAQAEERREAVPVPNRPGVPTSVSAVPAVQRAPQPVGQGQTVPATPIPDRGPSAQGGAARQTPAQGTYRPASDVYHDAPGTVYLKVPALSGDLFERACALCEIFDGGCAVILYDCANGKYVRAGHLSFGATPFSLSAMKRLLGEENVVHRPE